MKPVVYLHKKDNKFYLVEKKEGDFLFLRQLTKSGMLTSVKKVQDVKQMKSIQWDRIANCTLYQRVKFNKAAVDKIAFDDFMAHMNQILVYNVEIGRMYRDKEKVNEALRQIGRVVFSCFHLTKKMGETFTLDDVLDRSKSELLKVSIKKAMVQYLQERYENFSDNELEDKQVEKELELAKTMIVFSEKHEPIKKAAKRYMNLITTDLKERFVEVTI